MSHGCLATSVDENSASNQDVGFRPFVVTTRLTSASKDLNRSQQLHPLPFGPQLRYNLIFDLASEAPDLIVGSCCDRMAGYSLAAAQPWWNG